MKIQALFCRNNLKNINYIIEDHKVGKAICIDPFDADMIRKYLDSQNLELQYIFNTHEHWDHIRGNKGLKDHYGCEILSVPGVEVKDKALSDGQSIFFANTKLTAHYTPGHTMHHFCLLAESKDGNRIFSGDTLFNAGVGNCKNGGDVSSLYETFSTFFKNLDDSTMVYPGHDYIMTNLAFAKEQNPKNKLIDDMIIKAEKYETTDDLFVTTMKQERSINPFLRLEDNNIKDRLNLNGSSAKKIFFELRSKRDHW